MVVIVLLAAFACGFVYDFVWSRCVDAVTNKRAVLAANLGLILYACTLLSTVLIIEHCILAVLVYGIGNWLGVYLAVRSKK